MSPPCLCVGQRVVLLVPLEVLEDGIPSCPAQRDVNPLFVSNLQLSHMRWKVKCSIPLVEDDASWRDGHAQHVREGARLPWPLHDLPDHTNPAHFARHHTLQAHASYIYYRRTWTFVSPMARMLLTPCDSKRARAASYATSSSHLLKLPTGTSSRCPFS